MYSLLAVLAVLLLVGLAMLGYPYRGAEEPGKAPMRVAAVMISQDVPFWEDVWQGVRDAARAENIALSEYPYAQRAEDIGRLVQSAALAQVDGLILRPPDNMDEAYEAALRAAREQGIRIVTIDLDAPEALRDLFVGIDNTAAARGLAELALPLLGGGGRVAVLTVGGMPPTGLARMSAFSDTLRALSPGVTIEEVTLPPGEAQRMQALQAYFSENADSVVVFCGAVKMTIATANTVNRMGIADRVHVFGFAESEEAHALFRQGAIYALAAQQPYAMGVLAVQGLWALHEGEEWPRSQEAPAAHDMPYALLVKEDAHGGLRSPLRDPPGVK